MSGKTGELAPAHLPEQKSCQLLLLPHHQGSISPEPTHLGGEDSFPALTPASLGTSSIGQRFSRMPVLMHLKQAGKAGELIPK